MQNGLIVGRDKVSKCEGTEGVPTLCLKKHIALFADVAQLAEQLICNQ